MKKRDLETKLGELGFYANGGTKHDRWTHRESGRSVTVPRHREINEFTARAILRQAFVFANEGRK